MADLSDILGLHPGMDINDYHAAPGISKTGLDSINRSPAHYFGLHMNPARPPRKLRAGQLEGSLCHCATLEPAEFDKRYVVVPADAPTRPSIRQREAKKPSSETLAAIEWWDRFDAEHAGAQAITIEKRDAALRQAESIRKLPEIREALEHGQPEVSAFWIDPHTGVLCRCRPDWVHDCGSAGVILLDVKTYSDASAREFARQVARKRYAVQDAFYSDGYAAASRRDVLAFVFVAAEDEWPFAANALMLDDPSKAQGKRDYRRNLNTYADCVKSGLWPGFGDSIQIINLPAWAMDKEEA